MEIQNIPNGQLLTSTGCFKVLDTETIEYLNQHKTQLDYFKSETIVKQGAFAPHVLYVNKGLVKVYLQTGNQKQIGICIASAGDFMAFNAIFGENIYQYSASALTDSSICMIDKDALKKVLVNNPLFALEITSKNSKNEMRYLEMIHNLSYKQMRGKLASALLYLQSINPSKPIFQFLTRQDVADFASITIESTIKFLKEFEKEGLLQLEGKKINITKPTDLILISKNG